MSIRAIDWVFRQNAIASSQDKFVLVALADNAGDTGLAWPAVSTIALKTAQDRKTVIAALRRLQADGWIKDTGKRAGRTKQIKVYQLGWANERKESQRRNSSDFPMKDSQKRDTEPSVEPFSLSLNQPDKSEVIQHAEAKRLLGKLSQDVFGTKLSEIWPNDMECWLDQALPMKREDWELIDWFYRLPEDHRVFTFTARRQSMKALMENLPREIEKIRSATRKLGLNRLHKKKIRNDANGWTPERIAVFEAMFPGADPGRYDLLGSSLQQQIEEKADEIPTDWIEAIKKLYGSDVPIPRLKSQLPPSVRSEIEEALRASRKTAA
jgi:hypothetical protein